MATDELIARYDAAGTPVGTVPRGRMRAEGLWHAATAVLVRSSDGERVYVHLRAPDVFPARHGTWTGRMAATARYRTSACGTDNLSTRSGVALLE